MQQLTLFPDSLAKAKLPTNLTNNYYPVHRWFNFIAGFSSEFVSQCMTKANLTKKDVVIDPFAGLATTLVEANLRGIKSVGFEPHPFFYDIANAKLLIPQYQLINQIENYLLSIELFSGELEQVWSADAVIFFHKLFSENNLRILASGVLFESKIQTTDRNIYRLILSRILEMLLIGQTDGIYKAPTTLKKSLPYRQAVQTVCHEIRQDIEVIGNLLNQSKLYPASAENMINYLPNNSCSLCVTSPPYLNNFDFAEMTRMQLYFWRYANSWREITDKVRRQLIINTTTVPADLKQQQSKFSQVLSPAFRCDLQPLIEALIEARKIRPGKKDYYLLIYPYFAQMQSILRELWRVLKTGSNLHLIIADAALYGVHIKTEQLLTKLMLENSFEVREIDNLRARGDRWSLAKRQGSKTGLGEFHIHAVKIHYD